MSEITVNGVSLYYEEHGSGEPILGIHGTGSGAAFWANAAAELATRGRMIVYDRRGFSRSARPEPFVTDIRLQADDAAALIDALGATPAIVIGRSTGADIALDLALRYPGRVRALALLEGVESISPAGTRWLAELTGDVLAAAEVDLGTVPETTFRRVLGDAGWGELPQAAREAFETNTPAIVAEFRGGFLEPEVDELAGIDVPTLVVTGEDSVPVYEEVSRALASAIPGARLVIVEGDHFIDPAHPAILEFVDEVLARAPVSR